MTIDDIVFAICRGGWPKSLMNKTPRSKLEVAKDLYKQTYSIDISTIDKVKRDARWAQAFFIKNTYNHPFLFF